MASSHLFILLWVFFEKIIWFHFLSSVYFNYYSIFRSLSSPLTPFALIYRALSFLKSRPGLKWIIHILLFIDLKYKFKSQNLNQLHFPSGVKMRLVRIELIYPFKKQFEFYLLPAVRISLSSCVRYGPFWRLLPVSKCLLFASDKPSQATISS